MKNITIAIALAFALFQNASAQSDTDKAALAKQFKEFIGENQNLRAEHEKEVYELQKNFLEENYKQQVELLSKLSKLEEKLEFGEREKNKETRKEIRSTVKEFREKMKERRQSFFKETLRKQKQEFRESMKKRHSALKGELKSELDHPKKEGRKGKWAKKRREGKRQAPPEMEDADEDSE